MDSLIIQTGNFIVQPHEKYGQNGACQLYEKEYGLCHFFYLPDVIRSDLEEHDAPINNFSDATKVCICICIYIYIYRFILLSNSYPCSFHKEARKEGKWIQTQELHMRRVPLG